MGAINSKWARYCFASVADHFRTAADTTSLPLVIELLDDRSDAWKEAPSKAELLIVGPTTREISRGLHRIWINVFLTISSHVENDSNAYDHVDFVGVLQNAADRCIEVKDYDVGTASPTTIGVISPRNSGTDAILVDHIKPGRPDQLIHSIIEARYLGHFSEG